MDLKKETLIIVGTQPVRTNYHHIHQRTLSISWFDLITLWICDSNLNRGWLRFYSRVCGLADIQYQFQQHMKTDEKNDAFILNRYTSL